jgi:hypothetical protein
MVDDITNKTHTSDASPHTHKHKALVFGCVWFFEGYELSTAAKILCRTPKKLYVELLFIACTRSPEKVVAKMDEVQK